MTRVSARMTADLGKTEEPAAADDHRRDAALGERIGVDVGVCIGPEKHRDVTRLHAATSELGEAIGYLRRLAHAGRRKSLGSGVDEQHLDPWLPIERCVERLSAPTPGSRLEWKRPVPRVLLGAEHPIDEREDPGVRAVVRRQLGDQRPSLFHRRPVPSVDLHIRAAEAVDRLHLVADGAQVLPRHTLDQTQLQRVCVLELIDHHDPEPLAVPLGNLRPVDQQVDGLGLQVLEVEHSRLALELPIAHRVLDDEFAQCRCMGGGQRTCPRAQTVGPCGRLNSSLRSSKPFSFLSGR